MANVTITQLPLAGPITGQELVPIVQSGRTRQTTTAAIAAGPAQFQTFLTVNQEPTLANSRYVSAQTGIGITDNGAQSNFVFALNGASGSLEAASNGMIVKTGSTTVAARTLSTSGPGISIADGNGVAGNPTVSLTGTVSALASLATTGVLVTGGGSVNARVIAGTSDEISVANGDGSAGNPTVGLASNPVVPGTGGMRLPTGTTAQRISGNGYLRYNSDLGVFEGYANGVWVSAVVGGVTSVNASGGTTGLSFTGGPVTSVGTLTLTGTLGTANGGTGLATYTAGDLTYYASGTALTKLAIGTSTHLLTSSGSAPQWSAPSGITIGTATNLAGGTAGALPYQTGAGATTFLSLGTTNHVLTAGASAPQYVAQSTLSVGSATNTAITANSTNATNYLTFVSATTGNLPQLVNSSITCNPSTGSITGGISGGAF